MAKPLPVTTSNFRDLIENGQMYVDKTKDIYELIRDAKRAYFLSRPRRFGKSLLISTLIEIFHGNRELFQGLWLYESPYHWEPHPVIHIDFSQHTVTNSAEMEQSLDFLLAELADRHALTLRGFNYQTRFFSLIRQLAETRQVVILIDEYDKPILDNMDNIDAAKAICDKLKAFYGIIKAADGYLHMALLTGVSKFSQVSVFSTLNNLVDITMNTRFSAMLGITEHELRRDFADYIEQFATTLGQPTDAFLAEVRQWYDGFCFAANGERVYNPYSVIRLFYQQQFSNYWFETGTPTFLVKLIHQRNYELDQFEELHVKEIDFKTYELERLEIVPLLYQTGYLTIRGYHRERMREGTYTLAYPNYEVEYAFFTYLLNEFSYVERTRSRNLLDRLSAALQANDLASVFATLSIFFANIPYTLQIKYERYYQSIFYTIFMLLGLEIEAEVTTNIGRIDAVVQLPDQILLFEFKIDQRAQDALQQIKTNGYAEKYTLHNKPITLIGANFNSATRTIDDWVSEPLAL